jgi:hypothetical protein
VTDAALRDLERAAADDEPLAVDAFVAALRRAGEDARAWWVMVASLERRAARAERLLCSVSRAEPYDVEAHRHALIEAGRTIDRARRMPVLDGREHLTWERGQRVRIAKGAHQAKAPPGETGTSTVATGTEGTVIYIASPAVYRGRQRIEPEAKLHRGMTAPTDEVWRIGMRIEDHELRTGWAVFLASTLLERVPWPAWDVLDAQAEEKRLAEAGALPVKGQKLRTRRVDPKDGLTEVVIGTCGWSGVTKTGPRVRIDRRTKPVVWAALEDVEVLGPPPAPRCITIRSRR